MEMNVVMLHVVAQGLQHFLRVCVDGDVDIFLYINEL